MITKIIVKKVFFMNCDSKLLDPPCAILNKKNCGVKTIFSTDVIAHAPEWILHQGTTVFVTYGDVMDHKALINYL